MKIVNVGIFFICVVSIFDIRITKSLLPETIATTTLLKYSAAFIAAGVGGRYVVQGVTKFSQGFNMRIPKYSDVEFYTITESSENEYKNIVKKNIAYVANIKQGLFNSVKHIATSETIQEKLKGSCQKPSNEEMFDKNNWITHNWNQTNLNSQQARGFLPKINNTYYYNSGNENFWKGFAAGSFLTGITYHYIGSKK